ncbi:MAG: DUF4845 domain-containing protein [Nitrosomonas sp.]|nr:DUF4845 domain-containing protein [Nitrosomonas sp.]
MLVWSVILIFIAISGLRIIPAYIEYSTIKKKLNSNSQRDGFIELDLNQIRLSFSKRAQIDNIKSVSGQDIKINRENGQIVLSAGYTTKIPLISNISLNIDFEATSD